MSLLAEQWGSSVGFLPKAFKFHCETTDLCVAFIYFSGSDLGAPENHSEEQKLLFPDIDENEKEHLLHPSAR